MARTETAKGGEYELLADRYDEYDDKGNLVAIYERDRDGGAPTVVTLSDEQAERLTQGPRPAFGKPGEAARLRAEEARRVADEAQAQYDAAQAAADEAKSRAAEAAKAKAPASK